MELMDHQMKVLHQLGNGKVLWGGVGAGKTHTILAWYLQSELTDTDIYVITTARKRDSLDWEGEACRVGIGTEEDATTAGVLTVDSWNNIKKYEHLENCFFIFDEQRVVGHGAWVKSFLKIAKKNTWVLLTATPGDTWLDYAPVFIANGFYLNMTEFNHQHVQYERHVKFPKVKRYLNEHKLEMLRDEILVEMPYISHTTRVMNYLEVGYDEAQFKRVWVDRWHIYEDRPIIDAAEMWRVAKQLIRTDPSRLETIKFLMKLHPKLIIFYEFDYELECLRTLSDIVHIAEWNGHKHDEIPDSSHEKWVYLCQYTAASEAWNCVETDAMVFYSLTYSWKKFEQSQGRIDRMNTPFSILYYYSLMSNSEPDRAVKRSLDRKEDFNERRYLKEKGKNQDFREYRVKSCQI